MRGKVMWTAAKQQLGELLWLVSMLTGLSLLSVAVAAAALAIA
jgi:hypothetical protein